MAFETYWMQVFSPVSRKLKNGLHLIEAEPWRKGWWKVRSAGSARSTYISPRVWSANPHPALHRPAFWPSHARASPKGSKRWTSHPQQPLPGLAGQYVSLANRSSSRQREADRGCRSLAPTVYGDTGSSQSSASKGMRPGCGRLRSSGGYGRGGWRMKWLLIIAWVLPGTTVPQIKAEAADDLAHLQSPDGHRQQSHRSSIPTPIASEYRMTKSNPYPSQYAACS